MHDKDNIEKLISIKENIIENNEEFKKHKERYPKMTFEDLILELDRKGVTFDIIDEKEALNILKERNYYYKLTVYKRNFRKDDEGKYKNLDFSYLVDLANIDMRLRYLLLQLTLDIEHALKTYIITDITNNEEEDGYKIVRSFFHSTVNSMKEISKESILKSVENKSHYQNRLYKKHKEYPSAWVLMEVINLGDFLNFFEFYYKRYPKDLFDIKSIKGPLLSVKRIRNACAHNNAFIFDLYRSDIKRVSNPIIEFAKKNRIGEIFYKCNKVHDVMSVIYIYKIFVKGNSKFYRIGEFKRLIDESIRKLHYMDKSNDVIYFLKIIKKILNNEFRD